MAFKVAVITGYLKNPAFVQLLLESLTNQNFKEFDVYVYASPTAESYLTDSYIASLSYACYQLKLKENAGFAGNNNNAIKVALKKHTYKYIVLVNDDTVVQPDWLKELVFTAENHKIEKIGAVASKMVFYQRFITITGRTQTTKHGARKLGVRFYSNSRFETSFYNKRFYSNGFYDQEEDEIYDYRWSTNEFQIELPVESSTDDYYILKLFIKKNLKIIQQELKLFIDDILISNLELDKNRLNYNIKVPKTIVEKNWHYIIQNAGSAITPAYSGYDVGSGEIDRGQYDLEKEIETFCGGSFLITTDALNQTGLFIDGLFCYYEDSDLSLRLKRKGFKIVYNPKSIIQHYHTGSSKEWSPFFTYHAFRNKIIFSAKNFGFKAFIFSFNERLKETYVFFKLFVKSRFRNQHYKSRLRLNLLILKDSLIGIIKFKPSYIDENMHL